MDQGEFETRRIAQKKALKAVGKQPVVKVIDLVELLLLESPGLPVFVRVGSWKFPVACVCADGEENDVCIVI
ncbi:hypothetical protein ES705_21264 [subsurface metagenome]